MSVSSKSGAVVPLASPKAETVTVQPAPLKTAGKPRSASASVLTSPKAAKAAPTQSKTAPLTVSASSSAPSAESPLSPVFKLARAKKLFVQWDVDKDHFLSPSEFSTGLTSFVSSLSTSDLQLDLDAAHVTTGEGGRVTLSTGQVDALWKEADLDCDGRVSLAEFQWRFAGGPNPRAAQTKRATVALQTLKRVVKDATKMSVEDLRAILDAVYDGPNPRFKTVDLTKTEQLSNAILKRIMTQTLQAEKEQAAQQKRPMEDWAQHCWNIGGLSQKDCDRLFAALDVKKSGRIDLGPIFTLAAQKPGRAKGKKKTKVNPDYPLSTIKEEHLRDFINDLLFTHLADQQAALKANASPHTELRCHPPLDHWGDDDCQSKGLATRGDSGYKKTLLLSERTKVQKVVRRGGEGGDGFYVYALCRTEMTELKRVEMLYFARVELAETEEVKGVICAVKKSWRDGEVELNDKAEVIEGWSEHCGKGREDDELSIPPIA